jgi:outer membrane protein insertion porin family
MMSLNKKTILSLSIFIFSLQIIYAENSTIKDHPKQFETENKPTHNQSEKPSEEEQDKIENIENLDDIIEQTIDITPNDDAIIEEKEIIEKIKDNKKKQIEAQETKEEIREEEQTSPTQTYTGPRRVNQIIIHGNKLTPQAAIIKYIPYKTGEIFDARKTRDLIRNLYFRLKRFRNITVKGENVDNDLINIHVEVEEKKIIKDMIFEGNKHLTEAEIKKKIEFDDIPAVDEEELKIIAEKIKQLYMEKGYHQVKIDTKLEVDSDDRAIATFIIDEGKKSIVKRIQFKGNKSISSKELRGIMFTREDWVLSFLDKSGTYHPERVDGDKHIIGRYYQNKGFLHAKVIDVEKEMNEKTKELVLTYEIEEGDLYTIKEVKAPGNEVLSEEFLLARIPIRPGHYYSPDKIANAIKLLENIWGNYGYIFAHIEPSIEPDEDDKTVTIAFYSELGNKVNLNRINIRGNKKTRDKIIRRKIMLEEGEQINKYRMEASKRNVESLGYFDARDGVNWKINRLDDELADLELVLKEAKTGNFNVQIGFGGSGFDIASAASGFTVKGGMSDTNLFGSGIQFTLDGSWAKGQKTMNFRLAQPWLFDKPISAAMDIYHKRPSYDEFRNTRPVNAQITGGAATAGFITKPNLGFFGDTQVLFTAGVDNVKYEQRPLSTLRGVPGAEYQAILDKEFTPGSFAFVANNIEQDFRSHPMHPSRGHFWRLTSKAAIPTFGDNIGFFKMTFDSHWFTPLINEYDLVFHIHAFAGLIHPFGNRTAPYPELFHVGGPASVRGYLFGQISPRFEGDPIGGSKALFWTAELIFPITPDMSMKGIVFYDGGAGFSNPYSDLASPGTIMNNNFDYRHSVGVGLRLLNPMPIKIDWGFKLDPRKGESSHEIHFGMNYGW